MDWRAKRITQEVSKYDRTLFAVRTNTGMIQIWRKAERWSAADILDDVAELSSPTQFIFALTDNLTIQGNPIDMGLLPIMQKILEMDSWTKESLVDQIRKDRENKKEQKKQERKNDIMARAYDMRKEFARATNEFNVSSL